MATKSNARTGADFAAKHVRETAFHSKITAAFKAMLAIHPEQWEYESDLSKAPYNINSRDIAEYRDQYAKHVVQTEVQDGEKPRKVWFADPKVAARYRPKATTQE